MKWLMLWAKRENKHVIKATHFDVLLMKVHEVRSELLKDGEHVTKVRWFVTESNLSTNRVVIWSKKTEQRNDQG